MKLGNVSQTVIRTPNFFINPSTKKANLNTFDLPYTFKRKPLFREREYLSHPLLSSINTSRNFRQFRPSQPNFPNPCMFPLLTTSHSTFNNDIHSTPNSSVYAAKSTDLMKSTHISKETQNEFRHTHQANIDSLLNKINRISPRHSCELDSLSRKFSQTEASEHFKKTSGNGRYRNYDLQFENVLKHKALSLTSVSPKAKGRLNQKRVNDIDINISPFESIYRYKQREHYVPSFTETIKMCLSK